MTEAAQEDPGDAACETPMEDHWRSFVKAISKPGAVVGIEVPNEARTIWDSYSFGSSTQFIAERVKAVNAYGSTDALRSALTKLADAVDRERHAYENYRRLFDAEHPIAADKVVTRAADAFDAAYASTNEATNAARTALAGITAPSEVDAK